MDTHFVVAIGTFLLVAVNCLIAHDEASKREERWELEDLRLRARLLATRSYKPDRKRGDD